MRERSFARACVAYGLLIPIVAMPGFASAQETSSPSNVDQIIVSASRLETKESNVGSSVSVVTQEDLQQGRYQNVVQALRKVPGLDIVQSGGAGGNATAFIRGADSDQTLVLLDGIELNNPASPNRSFNLTNLTLENVDRIEIIRGPQSTIYGSDAMGGVINIISKKAKDGVHASASTEAGAYNTFNQVGSLSYGSEAIAFTSGVTRQDVGNISAADAKYGNTEHDDYQNTSLSGRLAFFPSDKIDGAVTTRYTRANSALDNSGGVGGDDLNRRYHNEEFFTKGELSGHLLDDTLTPNAWISYSNHSLHDNNDPDALNSDYLRSAYNGDLTDVGTKLTWKPREYFSGVWGGETQGERASSNYYSDGAYGPYEDNLSDQEARTNSTFLETRTSYDDDAFVDAGIRYDHHSIFGSATTFRIAPAWHVTDMTKLRSSVGTGFKAPSLVQLYSSFGNRDLEPERNNGWDVGVDQQIIKNKLSGSLTFFHNNYRDLITFDPSTYVLENINSAFTQGFEAATSLALNEMVSIKGAYTYTQSEDRMTNEELLRRPRNKGSVTVVYTPTTRFTGQVQWRMYGARKDVDYAAYPPTRVTLAGYGIVDLAATYKVSDSWELFTRVENLFDQDYEEVLGYGTLGCAGYGGVKVSL
jgi:vitamin B12 transporter